MGDSIIKGVFGISGSGLAVVASHQGTLELVRVWFPWLLGAAVALATLISIGFDIRRKWRDRNKP